jgi:branched-chain amino acid transport system substrate-binding protein
MRQIDSSKESKMNSTPKHPGSRSWRIRIGVGSTAVAVALAVAGCAPVSSNTSDGPVGGTLEVGYIGALSGPSSTYGQPALNGMTMAVDEINKAKTLPFKLKLVGLDDKADPTTSATLASQLVNEDKVVAVIGGPNSGTVKANNPVITDAGVVELISVAQDDSLIDPSLPGYPLTFRLSETSGYDIRATVSLLKAKAYKDLCVVTDTSAYGQGGLASIKKVFDDNNLTIHAVAQHAAGATDLTSQALQLRDAGCDAVYLFDLGPDAALFLKTVKQLSWNVGVIGARGNATSSFISTAGSTADGIAFPSTLDPSRPGVSAFISHYDAKYGVDSDPAHVFSSLGYDSVQMLAAGLKSSGGKGGTKLATALESVKLTTGITGRAGTALTFTAKKHEAPGDNYVSLWQMDKGKPVFSTTRFDVSAQ